MIDDSDEDQELIQLALRQVMPDLELTRANGCEQALELLATRYSDRFPHLILLDWYLPGPADGSQLLQTLKDPASVYRSIPVVVLSHSDSPDDIQRAYDLGCASYIVKSATQQDWLTVFTVWEKYWWQTVTGPAINRW